MSLAGFNALDAGSAWRQLLACCDLPGWADRLAEGRPYGEADALLAAEELRQIALLRLRKVIDG